VTRHPAVTTNGDAELTGGQGTMDDMRVLVVEDEPAMAAAVAEGLRREAFAVDVAHDGDVALERLGVNHYDVVVLDRDLPGVHGDDVCRAIITGALPGSGPDDGHAPRVLMLTAATTIRDRVSGLGLGADDYLPKPFAFAELAARVHALARRSRPAVQPVIERAGLRVDTVKMSVSRDGDHVGLSRKEFAVLVELLRAEGAVVSSEDLLERAWDENADPFTHVVRMTVMKLRRKLGDPPLVETVPGAGYRIA
jgi:DNA-binding response OmpR family regulator